MPQIIDTRWIDVDLAQEARRLNIPVGNISPSSVGLDQNHQRGLCSAPMYEDSQPLYPESDWPRLADLVKNGGLDDFIVEIKNQGQEGSCVGNQWSQQVQIAQARQFGKENTILISAISAYKQIGSSPNSGASVEDSYTEGRDVGVLPLDTPANRARFKHVMPATGFHTPWPGSDWKDTAKMFRITEAFIIQSVQGLISALFSGFTVGVGRAGHSIVYVRPVYNGNSLLVKYVNSWEQWGDAGGDFAYGFGYDSLNLIRQSAYWCFAVRTVTVPEFQLAA